MRLRRKIQRYKLSVYFIETMHLKYIPIKTRIPFRNKIIIIDFEPSLLNTESAVNIFDRHGIHIYKCYRYTGSSFKCSIVQMNFIGNGAEMTAAIDEFENLMALTDTDKFNDYKKEKDDIFTFILASMLYDILGEDIETDMDA